jgi:DNA primase
MSDIFGYLKNRVKIIDFIESSTQSKVEKVGSDTYRANPCPLCGHHDCCTLYPKTGSFHCFSCQRAGDVITFEKLYRSLPDNLEAAKSITEKMGISFDAMTKDTNPLGTKKNAHHQSKDTAKEEANIDEERIVEIRSIVADFYHNQLLDNEKALDYQTKKRAHRLEILKELKIGYAGKKSVIAAIKKEGYTVGDLIAIGLVKKWGNEYRAVIPQGSFVYPHQLDGKVLYFSIKTPPKINPFQIKKQYAHRGWLCFNQDALNSKGPIIITEGENDTISVIDKAKKHYVIGVIGNYNSTNILDYMKAHSRGRTHYLCFDRDEAGEKYTVRYQQAITSSGGEAQIIEIPPPHKDIDDFLRAAEDPQADFDRLLKAAKIIDNRKSKMMGHEKDNLQAPMAGSLVSQFNSFQVLGELEDGRISFWSKVKRKVYITSLKDLNLDTLDQIGGEEVRFRVVRSMNQLQEEKIHFFALKRDIIIEAGKTLLGEEKWYGQGVNLLEDGRLLLVNGDQITTWDGNEFHAYHEPMIERKFIKRSPAEAWIDLKELEKCVISMDRNRAQKICQSLLDLVRKWGFASEYAPGLVAGFLLAQMVQSLWVWRPHLWVSGPQGSGKTLLIELFDRIAGNLSRRYEGQVLTEAGFRQDLKHNFRLSLIDEFEKTNSRQELLGLLRSAGRGGSSTKGTPSGKAIHHSIRHMVLIASIERGLVRAAEKHRFIRIEMQKDPRRDPVIPTMEEAEQLRLDLFGYAIWAAFKAKQLIKNMPRLQGYETRLIEAYCVPLSMIVVAHPEQQENLQNMAQRVLDEQRETGEEIAEDEEALLEDILTSTIRMNLTDEMGRNSYSDRSVSQLLALNSELVEKTLQAYGIKLCREGLFLAPKIIAKKLLYNTNWQDLDIRSILKRLPGAEGSKQRRVGGNSLRGVLLTQWSERGDELDERDDVTEL